MEANGIERNGSNGMERNSVVRMWLRHDMSGMAATEVRSADVQTNARERQTAAGSAAYAMTGEAFYKEWNSRTTKKHVNTHVAVWGADIGGQTESRLNGAAKTPANSWRHTV